MVSTYEIFVLFNLILAILTIGLVFVMIGLLPFVIVKLVGNIDYHFKRRSFIKNLIRSLQANLIQNLKDIESIFLVDFPDEVRTQQYPFIINNELRHFIGLINSVYKDTIGSDINFRGIPPEKLQNLKTIIERIILENREKLYYADLPLEDRVAFKEILDYFKSNPGIDNQYQIFIRTRLMEIKRILLKKNDDIKRCQYVNYGAFIVGVVGAILTILFGLQLIGG